MAHYRETPKTQEAWTKLKAAEQEYWDDLNAVMTGKKPFTGSTERAEKLMAAHEAFVTSWEEVR